MAHSLLSASENAAKTLAILNEIDPSAPSPFFTERVLCRHNRETQRLSSSTTNFRLVGVVGLLLFSANAFALDAETTPQTSTEREQRATGQFTAETQLPPIAWEQAHAPNLTGQAKHKSL
ncbi:MAG: hypothetical protein AAGN35_21395 [Bacteroidota bacterium]